MQDVDFRARFDVNEERVRVKIRVVNRRSSPIYVLDIALRVGKNGVEVRRDQLLPTFLPPRTAVLSSRLFPLDPTAAWATPPTAWTSRVEGGASLDSTLEAPLPLRVSGELPRGGRCDRIRIDVGVVPDSPTLRAHAETIGGVDLYEISAQAVQLQQILVAEEGGVSIPMEEKAD